MPTVVVGSALDIVEHCGVPRFLFTDFPLGNPCGKPWTPEMQRSIVSLALDLLESAKEPRARAQVPFHWGHGEDDATWRRRYLEITPEKRDELRREGERRRASQQRAKEEGRARSD
jgi:hypothetical protein